MKDLDSNGDQQRTKSATSNTNGGMETLSQCLCRIIGKGAPLYDQGQVKQCYELYLETARYVVEASVTIQKSGVGQRLEQAIEEATQALQEAVDAVASNNVKEDGGGGGGEEEDGYNEAAWILRRCFDEILEAADPSRAIKKRQASILIVPRGALDDIGGGDSNVKNSKSVGHDAAEERWFWREEPVLNTPDHERGQALADIAYILRSSIQPAQHSRFLSVRGPKTFNDSFPASQAVETLTSLGLAASRKMATKKMQHLFSASYILNVSHPSEQAFQDGTRLYRFPNRLELEQAMKRIMEKNPVVGTDENVYLIALRTTLDLPTLPEGKDQEAPQRKESLIFSNSVAGGAYWTMSSRGSRPHPSVVHTPEHARGQEIAALAAALEPIIDIRDRKYNFKTYTKCFIGKEAVDQIIASANETGISSREQAIEKLSELVQYGLVHHVTRDHLFEDKHLFYRFASIEDIKISINASASLPAEPVGDELTKFTALVHRYKQFTSLNIAFILNKFFGTETEEGWDRVDLESWRHNMKRWGFGHREDQDDDMVQALAPLLTNIDPDTWTPDDSDDDDGKQEWESPYGILAQIALFDQIPRSAFRGTPDAFKWDRLAMKATKVALEKGYFETAYKSTMNQFLLLLPLEHSEAWEDQKLGVRLLLQLLSTVAVQDNDQGLSDYEIVKRLEFTKRLTTAFLEHAQVIAKYKRYPHRNKALGRNTRLEERIWLASDFVPRWARSQNPEDARNVIQLPVIPLKRFTKR